MRTVLKKRVPITPDTNLGPPQARWRNHFAQWVMVELLAILSLGRFLPVARLTTSTVWENTLKSRCPSSIWRSVVFVAFIVGMMAMGRVVWAAEINVPDDQPTIQAGIDAATDSDTVLVQSGTYVENINFNGKNLTVKSTDGAENTVIDGNQSESVVTFVNGENATAVLDGFTITNGSGTLNTPPGGVSGRTHGGGIWVYNNSSPTLTNLIVTGNSANHGGGIGTWSNSSPSIVNVILANNTGSWGGALGCWFQSNPSLINVTITGNSGYMGDGVYAHGSHPRLTNSILWNNSPEEIFFYSGSNAVTVAYSIVQGGQSGIVGNGTVNWLAGNIDADPLFVDAANGDYHILASSPAINAGTPTGAPNTDIEGNPRPNPTGSNPDMGAYEDTIPTVSDCDAVIYSTADKKITFDTLAMELYNPITDGPNGQFALFSGADMSLKALPGFYDFEYEGGSPTYTGQIIEGSDNCYPTYSAKKETVHFPKVEVPLVGVLPDGSIVDGPSACYEALFIQATTQATVFSLKEVSEMACE